jgi:hypothetical protein
MLYHERGRPAQAIGKEPEQMKAMQKTDAEEGRHDEKV